MCVLGAEILQPSPWTGITTTAVVGKRPFTATWWWAALIACPACPAPWSMERCTFSCCFLKDYLEWPHIPESRRYRSRKRISTLLAVPRITALRSLFTVDVDVGELIVHFSMTHCLILQALANRLTSPQVTCSARLVCVCNGTFFVCFLFIQGHAAGQSTVPYLKI